MIQTLKNRKIAAVLAFTGAAPLALPGMTHSVHLVGLHKLYLGQYGWFVIYLLLGFTPIPWIAGVLEGIWYLVQEPEEFDWNFNQGIATTEISLQAPLRNPKADRLLDVTDAVRELDQLRQDGLISEYEFEQKRRKLLDRIS
ncbi:MAG: hypothetical protein B0A82_10920 [Alkalinema sp. CACIAM 70d]|nr:MAG: hypothetical protein B0A82_10920 [Alkalinema sp. CACIAM 70d]